jgi:hypothetical protein
MARINIIALVGFGRATRPGSARTCLFRLSYTQNGALRPPPMPHRSLPPGQVNEKFKKSTKNPSLLRKKSANH